MKLKIDNNAFMEYMKNHEPIDAVEEITKILHKTNQIYKIINRQTKIKRIYQ